MKMEQLMKKAAGILLAIIIAINPAAAFSAPALIPSGMEAENPGVSADKAVNPDIASFCGASNCETPSVSESPLSAVTADSYIEHLTALAQGLQNLLPSAYTVDVVSNGSGEQLTIAYTGSFASQAAGSLSLLRVGISENSGGKLVLDMNSLQLDFKGRTFQSGDTAILEDGIASLLETGFIGTPAIDDASYSTAANPDDLYEILSLAQINVSSVSTTGTGANQTRNVAFTANGLSYTASRKSGGFTTTLAADAAIRAAMNYIIGLQTSLGSNYKVMVESRTGRTVKVSIKPRAAASVLNQISRIEFSLAGAAVTANSVKIYTVSGQAGSEYLQSLISDKAASMLYSGALILSSNNTSAALAHLIQSKITGLNITNDNATSVAAYENSGKTYKLSYSGNTLIVQNITDDAAMRDFIFTQLRQTLPTAQFDIELISISAQGVYEVKVTSKASPLAANAFSSMTFKLSKPAANVELVAGSLAVTYKNVAANTNTVPALFGSFGISTPGQSPAALSSITSLSAKLTALAQLTILKAFGTEAGKISFTYNGRDYRTVYEAGTVPFVEDRTDYRLLTPYLAGLKTKFPGMTAVETRSANGTYQIVLSDASTVTGELVSIEYTVDLSSGAIVPSASTMKAIYKNIQSGTAITGSLMTLLTEGLKSISGKTSFDDTLTLLASAKVEKLENSVFTIMFGGKRYDIKTENGATAVLKVYDETAETYVLTAALKTAIASLTLDSSTKAAVDALIAQVSAKGGDLLMSSDRDGSKYFSFFTDANGTFTTIKIANDPRNDAKTVVISSQTLTALTTKQYAIYIHNHTSDAYLNHWAGTLVNHTYTAVSLTLNYVAGGPSIISGTNAAGNPFHVMVYADKSMRIFLGSSAPTAVPNLTAGAVAAATVFNALDDYIGRMDIAAAREVENLRKAIADGTVKFINVEKAGTEVRLSWFTDRNGTAKQITLLPLVVNFKPVVAAGLTAINPLVSGQTKSLISFIELYLKNFTSAKAVDIELYLNKLRGTSNPESNPTSMINVTISASGITFAKASIIPSSRYTLVVSNTGVISISQG